MQEISLGYGSRFEKTYVKRKRENNDKGSGFLAKYLNTIINYHDITKRPLNYEILKKIYISQFGHKWC